MPTPTPTPDTTNATVRLPGLRVRTAPGTLDLGRLPEGERVTVVGRFAWPTPQDATWVGLEGLGWVRYDANNIALDRPLDTLPDIDGFDPRVAAPLHPDDTRTGIPAVDTVIEAVLSMDTATLASLVQTSEQPCSDASDADTPWACPEGVPPGTVVAKFDIAACGGDRGPAEELPLYVDALFDPEHQGYRPTPTSALMPLHLYAVLPSNPSVDGYLVSFAYSPGSVGRALTVTEDGQLSRIWYGCDDPVGSTISPDRRPILRPYAPSPLTPPRVITAPPPTGVPAVDAVFTAVQSGDKDTLATMIELTAVECRPDDRPGYDPTCSDLGLDPGETYQGIPVGSCDVGMLPAHRVPELIDEMVDPKEKFVTPFGAYLQPDDTYLGGAAVVMFTDPDEEPVARTVRVFLLNGRIVRVTGSCGELLPVASQVARWLVHPTALGYDLVDAPPPIPDDAGRFFDALTSAGLEAVPAPEACTLPWLTISGVELQGTRLRIGETAAAALFDLRDEATRTAVRDLVRQPLPDPLIAGPRAIWVTDQALVVLWNHPAYPAIEQIITTTLGEPLLIEPAE